MTLVVAPLLLLGLFESGLRTLGRGYSTRFFLEKELDGEAFYVTNKAFYQQFFSQPIDAIWEGSEWRVAAEKPEATYRVFILGGSAAQGYPDPAYSFWRILDVMLRMRFPNTHFEVRSAAHPGVNSHVMRAVARACAKARPDLFVVYLGNNEVNGPFGAVTAVGKRYSRSLPLIRARISLTDMRLAQILSGHGRKPWQYSEETVQQYFHSSDPRLEWVQKHFEKNLEDICATAASCGARAVLCTVGANLRDYWPGESVRRDDLTEEEADKWEALYQTGIGLEESGAHQDAIQTYLQALAIDSGHAELHFRLGRCHWAAREYEKAREHFLQALECDAFRSRAYCRINDGIARVASERAAQEVYLADAARYLAERSPHGVPGREVFWDNCHLTFEGNYAVACAVFEQVARWFAEEASDESPQQIEPPSLSECAERLAYTPGVLKEQIGTILSMNAAWGGKPVPWLEQRLAQLNDEAGPDLLEATAEAYRRALTLHGQDYYLGSRYVQVLLDLGEMDGALEQARLLVSGFPYRRGARRLLGIVLARAGKAREAISEFQEALAMYPDDAKTHFELGCASVQTDEFEQALAAFRQSLAIDPNNVVTKCKEGGVLEGMGDLDGAAQAYREAIAINPKVINPYSNLDSLYIKRKDPEGRLEEWRQVVRAFPQAALAHYHLGMAFEGVQSLDKAVVAYGAASELDPFDHRIQANLGQALAAKGDFEAAVEPLKKALERNPSANHLRPLLIEVLRETKDFAAAWEEVERCKALGVTLPPELTERLARDSGGSP